MSLCHYFAVNILLFLICLDKHISLDYFFYMCFRSACLRVRFWFIDTRVLALKRAAVSKYRLGVCKMKKIESLQTLSEYRPR